MLPVRSLLSSGTQRHHEHAWCTACLQVFEVGRRYKIMNPDKMRSEYGKLMYLLMDSSDSHIQDLLEFK